MANDITVHRSFQPGEILVEVVSVGLFGLTAAEVPIAPIAGLAAGTVQRALERIDAKFKPESGLCKLSLLTYGTSNSSAAITQNVKYVKIANVVFVDGSITVEAVPDNWTASIDIVQLTGMPFATKYTTTGIGSYSNSNAGYTGIWLSTSNNQTYIGKTNVAQALTYRPGLVAREIKVGDVFNISTRLIV